LAKAKRETTGFCKKTKLQPYNIAFFWFSATLCLTDRQTTMSSQDEDMLAPIKQLFAAGAHWAILTLQIHPALTGDAKIDDNHENSSQRQGENTGCCVGKPQIT
jgi:hypothetical protein